MPVSKMSEDWKGDSMGSADEVRKKISSHLSVVNWTDPVWGIFAGDGFSLEFNIGNGDPVNGFMVHVRGEGAAIDPLVNLAEQTGWYMLDCSQGEWIHHCKDRGNGWDKIPTVSRQAFKEVKR